MNGSMTCSNSLERLRYVAKLPRFMFLLRDEMC